MFKDRQEAGERLAAELEGLPLTRPVVYALPRGGVPVAVPVAESLRAPMDLLLVRKIGVPRQPELAAGAIVDGESSETVFNADILRQLGLTEADFQAEIERKLEEIETRRALYLGQRDPVPAEGRSAIVVDDGIATGATVKAALKGLRRRNPGEIILAVPVAPREALEEMKPLVDRVICLETPAPFFAVGAHYRHFDQVGDETVSAIMGSTTPG